MVKIKIEKCSTGIASQTHHVSVSDGNKSLIEGSSFASSEVSALLVAGAVLERNDLRIPAFIEIDGVRKETGWEQ